MRDFTLYEYQRLLAALLQAGYRFVNVAQYIAQKEEVKYSDKIIILRHDVDKNTAAALRMARLENGLKVSATYYFRAQRGEQYIPQIVDLGHEIGYHYEDVATKRGDINKAYESFTNNLHKLRQYYPVLTCAKHGSVGSKTDEHLLWQKYDYHGLALVAEAYLDIDFHSVCYLTDTARMWDSHLHGLNRYDRVPTCEPLWQRQNKTYHTTEEMISAVQTGTFPRQVMLNAHPQRWHNNFIVWTCEYARQLLINTVKKQLINETRE